MKQTERRIANEWPIKILSSHIGLLKEQISVLHRFFSDQQYKKKKITDKWVPNEHKHLFGEYLFPLSLLIVFFPVLIRGFGYIYKNKARVTVYFRSTQVFHHFVLLKKQVLQKKVADENSGCWGFWRTLSRCTQNIFTSTVHRLHIEYLGLSMLPHGLGPTEWHTHRPAKHPWADFAVDTIHCKKKLRFMFNGFNYIPQK